MCGIHGIVSLGKTPKDILEKKVRTMLKISEHRGPDQSDVVILDGVALGMNRLSIVAPKKQITIQSADEQKYALFNGEIVNYKVLVKLLDEPPAIQDSDTAVILPLFKKFGNRFVEKLAGMFAIAIYDQENGTLFLWRDPLGVKPLYYYRSKDFIIFSSEIKAIYAVMDEKDDPDFAAIDHCLTYRFHPGVSSVFPKIQRVLPGEEVTFKGFEIKRKRYWSLQQNSTKLEKGITIEAFRNFLTEIIKEYSQADVKGGYFVSGGLDSSLVTAIALQFASPYKTPISITFSPHHVVDEEFGQLLEKSLKTKFEWVTITDQIARDTLKEVVRFIDEPLENPIHIGTYLMAKRAKELGIKSILTGDGSDEFFLGYERIAKWFTGVKDPPKAYAKLLWTLTPEEAHELYTPLVVSLLKPMVDSYNNQVEPFKNVGNALLFERLDHLSEYHNMRIDRMTMAHGVEARVPFEDHRLVEYTLKIPHKNHFGVSGKDWLQNAAKPWVPAQILNRQKIHFPSLPDQWLSGEGADWTKEILLDPGAHTKRWIKGDVLERYIKEHKDKTRQHGRLLWALLVLELWLQNLETWR